MSHFCSACSIPRALSSMASCRWKPSILLRVKHPTPPADLITLSNHSDGCSAHLAAWSHVSTVLASKILVCHSWSGRWGDWTKIHCRISHISEAMSAPECVYACVCVWVGRWGSQILLELPERVTHLSPLWSESFICVLQIKCDKYSGLWLELMDW